MNPPPAPVRDLSAAEGYGKGAPCLATATLGHKLRVTYHKVRLYTFTNDTGHSVTGNGVAGFHVAKVTKACTAAAG